MRVQIINETTISIMMIFQDITDLIYLFRLNRIYNHKIRLLINNTYKLKLTN